MLKSCVCKSSNESVSVLVYQVLSPEHMVYLSYEWGGSRAEGTGFRREHMSCALLSQRTIVLTKLRWGPHLLPCSFLPLPLFLWHKCCRCHFLFPVEDLSSLSTPNFHLIGLRLSHLTLHIPTMILLFTCTLPHTHSVTNTNFLFLPFSSLPSLIGLSFCVCFTNCAVVLFPLPTS